MEFRINYQTSIFQLGKFPRLFLLTLLFLLLVQFTMHGQKTFTGTGNFSDATKWTSGTLPTAGQNLIIDGTCTVDNAAGTDNVAYGTLTIGTATGRTLNWAAGGTNRLNVSNVSAGAGASTLNMTNGGTLIIRGTWTSTNLTFTRGTGTIEVQSTMSLPAAYTNYTNLTINSAGTVTLGVNNTVVNGSLNITTGTLQLTSFNLTSGDLQGSGTISSSSGAPTFTVGSLNTSTTFSGVIGTGAIALTKNGTGTLTLSGSNTYTGLTTVSAGTLKLGSPSALGTTAGATSVSSGAVLDLNGTNYSSAEGLTLAGTGISSGGCLINSSSTAATYAGNITLSTTAPTITAGNPITLSGVISGGNTGSTNSLTIAGNSTLTGALTLSGNNTYTGKTTVNAGAVLKIGADNVLGAATAGSLNNSTVITSGAVLDLNGITYTANEYFELDGTGISSSGAMINSSSTTANFACQFDTWYGGTITADNPIILSGTVQWNGGTPATNTLTKAGSSTLTLTSSAGSKSNGLFITGGTLVLGVNDAIGTSGNTTISNGAVLDLNGYSSSRPLTSLNGTGISGGGALINSSATAATCSGAITLGSASSIVGGTGTITITGTITGAGFGLTLSGAAGGSVSNVISGASTTLTKDGSGTWNLSALNTYTGSTTVTAGILRATNNTIVASTNGAFGNNASGLYLNGGTIQSNVATFSRPITVSATNSGLDGYASARTISSTINNATGSTLYNLNIGGTTNGVLEGQALTLSGVITNTPGTLSLTKIGTNTVSFSNQDVTVQNLIINAGTLTITSSTGAKSFGNLIINNGGTFTNTTANAPIAIFGNLQNDGTFSQGTGRVTFTGAASNTVTGTAATTAFGGGITINKGTANTDVLDVQCVITMVSGGLTLTNGTFKLSSASTITPFTADISTTPYLIPSSAGLWCNGGTISPSANNWSVDGLLRVTSGTVTVGNAANHILGPKPNSLIMIEGGSLNITGRISNPANPWTFNMTGGTMTVSTMGTTTASRPPFNMDVASCSFSMSGGTIVIERAGGSAGQNLGFYSVATSGSGFTGGTLQIGNGSTPAASTIGITSTNAIYNLTVNSSNATATLQTNNLTVTNTVTISAGILSANNLNLTVGGNWVNNGSYTAGTATVTLNGTSAQSVEGSYTSTFNNLTIANASGITLGVSQTVNGTLTLTSGIITIGTYDLTIGNSGSITGASASSFIVTGSTGTLIQNNLGTAGRTGGILFPVGTNTSSYTPITVNNSGTADAFNVRVFDNVYLLGTSGAVISSDVVNKTWMIDEVVAGGSNVTLTAQWNTVDEASGFDRTSCGINHYISSAWDTPPAYGAASGSNPYTISRSGITSFSPFAVSETGAPLPVVFLVFDAILMNGSVHLDWITGTEKNNEYFTVERSSDSNIFEAIGTVKGSGNSSVKNKYEFTDNNLRYGVTYYRIKQTDANGNYGYSSVIAVTPSLVDLYLYPNPSTFGQLTIMVGKSEEPSTISICDLKGTAIFTGRVEASSDNTRVNLTSVILPGVYIVELQNGNSRIYKKLILN